MSFAVIACLNTIFMNIAKELLSPTTVSLACSSELTFSPSCWFFAAQNVLTLCLTQLNMVATRVIVLPTTPLYNDSNLKHNCKDATLQVLTKKYRFTPPTNQYGGSHKQPYNHHNHSTSNLDLCNQDPTTLPGLGHPRTMHCHANKPLGDIICTLVSQCSCHLANKVVLCCLPLQRCGLPSPPLPGPPYPCQ